MFWPAVFESEVKIRHYWKVNTKAAEIESEW